VCADVLELASIEEPEEHLTMYAASQPLEPD